MEWEIKPFGKESAFSGNPFQDGDTVNCFLVRNSEGAVVRMDLDDRDLQNLDAATPILGRWSRVFEASPDRREENQNQQRTLEELFFSLFEVEEAVEGEETATLKQIVSLMLERKRVLRRLPVKSTNHVIAYVHSKTKNEFEVPVVEITPKEVMKVQEQLQVLVR
ncbi:MAG: hypothetical protein KJT03_17060 [Verrucomicrobiae bacterium]|nr:hypothetical protein [Verrucomicrobiae bacterium]